MQAAVHETGPPGDGATISDGGVAVFDHSNILTILSSSSLAIFSASSVVPGRDADVVVVVVTTTNIKIASFSKGMSWTHGAQTPIVAHGTVSNCSRARITTRSVIGLHLFTPVPARDSGRWAWEFNSAGSSRHVAEQIQWLGPELKFYGMLGK
ncbi:hypothetical protein Tco_0726759 [Tanacetum coccineum]|uniref:Uncharacterized protein n=1 Tax=Tanacetum coccineum TaxID=301880 RepID=A0ABQ4YJF4_9ASTR